MIFKCKNCGGNAVYEPGRKMMYCPHCESLDSEDIVPDNTMTECVNCGAPINIGGIHQQANRIAAVTLFSTKESKELMSHI